MLRLQCKGTVEERVLQASSEKRSLADRSITGQVTALGIPCGSCSVRLACQIQLQCCFAVDVVTVNLLVLVRCAVYIVLTTAILCTAEASPTSIMSVMQQGVAAHTNSF